MRPRLRNDVTFYRLEDGTVFHRDGRWFKLEGLGTYDVLERLTPRLDGTLDVDVWLAGLSAAQAGKLGRLIGFLQQCGFLIDVAEEAPHQLSPQLLSTYRAEIAFLGAQDQAGAAHFEHFRHQRVLVLGEPQYASAQALAFAQLGLRQTLIYPPPTPDLRSWLQESCTWLHERDSELTIEGCSDPTAALAQTDIVVVAALSAPLQPFTALIQQLKDRAVWVMPVLVAGDEAWIGPITRPSTHWIRWWSQLDPLFTDQPAVPPHPGDACGLSGEPASEFWSPHTASYLANLAAFEMMQWISRPSEDGRAPQTLHVELETFEVDALDLSSLTLEESRDSAAARAERLTRLLSEPALDWSRFSRLAVSLIGDRRPVTSFGEAAFTQLPLHVIHAHLADPATAVYAAGLSAAEARVTCMRRAIERLQHDHYRRASGAAWMADVLSGDLIDCAAVLDHHPAGLVTASGGNWAEAHERALMQLYLDALLTGAGPCLYRDEQPLEDVGSERLERLLHLAGRQVQRWRAGSPQLPVSLIALDGAVVSASVAPVLALARRDSLMQAVLAVQSEAAGETVYRPLPPHVSLGVRDELTTPCSPAAQGSVTEQIAAFFLGRGQRCVSTPASTCSPLLTVLPFVAHAAAIPRVDG